MFAFPDNKRNHLIKNFTKPQFETHFKWQVIGIIMCLFFSVAGIVATILLAWNFRANLIQTILFLSPLAYLLATMVIRRWETAFIMIALTAAAVILITGFEMILFLTLFILGGITGIMIQICKEWERAIVLRLGKFRKVKGPGLFFLFPFIDSVVKKVDLRIRVTDFAAETTLTRDSVPVTVDALCFWVVWDAEKAILEVENYIEAVVLSSQTALRAAISANTLSTLLADGEKIEEEVRKEVDRKTTEWGITIQHIEITEIEIPDELRKTLSTLAHAEREKEARIRLSEAEKEVALRLEEASRIYQDNPIALKLKNLSVLQEGFKNGNSMVVVPSQLPGELDEDKVFGLKALTELQSAKGPGKEAIK